MQRKILMCLSFIFILFFTAVPVQAETVTNTFELDNFNWDHYFNTGDTTGATVNCYNDLAQSQYQIDLSGFDLVRASDSTLTLSFSYTVEMLTYNTTGSSGSNQRVQYSFDGVNYLYGVSINVIQDTGNCSFTVSLPSDAEVLYLRGYGNFRIGGYSGDVGVIRLKYAFTDVTLTESYEYCDLDLVAQPVDAFYLDSSEPVSFSVDASGNGVQYQWLQSYSSMNNSVWFEPDIENTRSNTITVYPDDTFAGDATYKCVVSDYWGNEITTNSVQYFNAASVVEPDEIPRLEASGSNSSSLVVPCIEFFIGVFGQFFTWLDTGFMITDSVSWLGLLVAVFIIIVIIRNFIPKG